MSNTHIATTFLKGIELLRAFGSESASWTLADLASRSGYDRATTRRLCLTLVAAGLVNQSGRNFALSPRVLTFAGDFLKVNDFGLTVQPVLSQFAEALDGEITFAVLDGNQALYVARSAVGRSRVSLGMTVGSTLPLLPTAIGRMLLATAPPNIVPAVVAALPNERKTSHTETDPGALCAAIAQARDSGHATVREEYENGVCGIAVPVGGAGHTLGVVGTSFTLAGTASDEAVADSVSLLHQTAARLQSLHALSTWPSADSHWAQWQPSPAAGEPV